MLGKGGLIPAFIFVEDFMRVRIINKKSSFYGRTGECKRESKVVPGCFVVRLEDTDFSFRKEDLEIVEEAV